MVASHGKVGAIIQARARSVRFKGKVLLRLPFGGAHSLVQNIALRARNVSSVDVVSVATSSDPANDAIAADAAEVGAVVYRGSEDNVLERFYHVATEHKLRTIVRLTGDNPCIDSSIIDHAVEAHEGAGADYTKSTGLPVGMNVEVMSYDCLTRVQQQASSAADREHVTLFVNRNPGQFRIVNLDLFKEEYADVRMTVDWESDYAFACFLYNHLYAENPYFGLDAVMKLLVRYPWAKQINRTLPQERQEIGREPIGRTCPTRDVRKEEL